MARYISLYSGSSGNCSVVEEEGRYILIDLGRSARFTSAALREAGLDPSGLEGIFISHEHSDHIGGLEVFTKRHRVPVFTNPYTAEYLFERGIADEDSTVVMSDTAPVRVGPFTVWGFYVPHDAAACMGYRILTRRGSSMAIATDIGSVTDSTYSNLVGAGLVVIESNYDENMLRNGPYPANLKFRVGSRHGHLSNREASSTVLRLMEEGTGLFHLCHLSEVNNTPRVALEELLKTAGKYGIEIPEDVIVKVNRRHEMTPPTEF